MAVVCTAPRIIYLGNR